MMVACLKCYGRVYHNLGYYHQKAFQLDSALFYYKMSLKYYETPEFEFEWAETIIKIAWIYAKQDNESKSIELVLEVLPVFEKNNDFVKVGGCYAMLGEYNRRLGNFNQSKKYLFKQNALFDTLSNPVGKINATLNLATLYSDLHQHDSALIYYRLSINHNKGLRYNGMTDAYLNMAHEFNDLNQPDSIKKVLDSALHYYNLQNLKDYGFLKVYWNQLYQYHLKLNEYDEAIQAYELYRDYTDSLLIKTNEENLLQIQTEYETEEFKQKIQAQSFQIKKEKQTKNFIILISGLIIPIIILIWLKFRNKQKQKNEREKLRMANLLLETEQKLLRSQLNPHFIGNSLSAIKAFIINNNKEEAATHLTNFASLMRKILESSSTDFLSLKDEIEIIESYLSLEKIRLGEKLKYSIDINPEIKTHCEQFIIPSMLLQPLVENAIQHGRNSQNEVHIEIHIQPKNEEIFISIRDYGAKMQTTNKGHKSLSGQITNQRIKVFEELHDFKLKFQTSRKDNGTEVQITLPGLITIE